MTGGIVTILGNTGYNFGAGMTGGIAYVLDLDRNILLTALTRNSLTYIASSMNRWKAIACIPAVGNQR